MESFKPAKQDRQLAPLGTLELAVAVQEVGAMLSLTTLLRVPAA